MLNGVIGIGYAIAFFVATRPLLDVYGITPNPEASFMARWFGVGLLAIGLTTWLARDAAESAAGRAIVLALAVSYGVGVAPCPVGDAVRPVQPAWPGRGGLQPAAGVGLWILPPQAASSVATSGQLRRKPWQLLR
jgi:hypothetical protein